MFPEALSCDVNGGFAVSIHGVNFGTVLGKVSVQMTAESGFPVCTPQSVVDNLLICTMGAFLSGGFDVLVVVTVDGQTSISRPYLSFYAPSLKATSIRLSPLGSSAGVDDLQLAKMPLDLLGDSILVTMDGTDFGTDPSAIGISYGPPGTARPKLYPCVVLRPADTHCPVGKRHQLLRWTWSRQGFDLCSSTRLDLQS